MQNIGGAKLPKSKILVFFISKQPQISKQSSIKHLSLTYEN